MVKNLDVFVVGLGMTIGFAIVLMNFTGMWPCNIIQSLNKLQLADYIRTNPLLNDLADYIRTNPLLNKIIGDVHYWSTYLFRCR